MEAHSGSVELGLEVGLGGIRWLWSLGGSDSPSAIREEFELPGIGILHGRSLIGNSDRPCAPPRYPNVAGLAAESPPCDHPGAFLSPDRNRGSLRAL
jgi:hypothetical protein